MVSLLSGARRRRRRRGMRSGLVETYDARSGITRGLDSSGDVVWERRDTTGFPDGERRVTHVNANGTSWLVSLGDGRFSKVFLTPPTIGPGFRFSYWANGVE